MTRATPARKSRDKSIVMHAAHAIDSSFVFPFGL